MAVRLLSSKKGMFFTLIAILMVSVLFITFSPRHGLALKGQAGFTESRISTADDFVETVKASYVPMALRMASYNALNALSEYLKQRNSSLFSDYDELNRNFAEVMLNGSIFCEIGGQNRHMPIDECLGSGRTFMGNGNTSVYSCSETFYSTASDGEVSLWDSTNYLAVHDAATGIVINTASTQIIIGQLKGANWEIRRAFFFFDTSSLGAGANISSATLSLYGMGDSSDTDFDITIQNGQPTYPRDPLVADDYNKNLYSGNGGSLSTVGFAAPPLPGEGGGYNNIALNADGISWINKIGTTKLSLRSGRDINSIEMTGPEAVQVWATEKGAGYQPKLVVTYTSPDCDSIQDTTGNRDFTQRLRDIEKSSKATLLVDINFSRDWYGDYNVALFQNNETGPFQVGVNITVNFSVNAGIAWWNDTERISTVFSFDGIEDPLYSVKSQSGLGTLYTNVFNQTNITAWNITNTFWEIERRRYRHDEEGSSFLTRFTESDERSECCGIESLINPFLTAAAGVGNTEKPYVDWCFFGTRCPLNQPGSLWNVSCITDTSPAPEKFYRFALDTYHAGTYNVTDYVYTTTDPLTPAQCSSLMQAACQIDPDTTCGG